MLSSNSGGGVNQHFGKIADFLFMHLNNFCTIYTGKHKINKCRVLFREFTQDPRSKSKVGNQI